MQPVGLCSEGCEQRVGGEKVCKFECSNPSSMVQACRIQKQFPKLEYKLCIAMLGGRLDLYVARPTTNQVSKTNHTTPTINHQCDTPDIPTFYSLLYFQTKQLTTYRAK